MMIWPHSCGFCGTTSTLQRLYPPSHCHGLIFLMARSHPAQEHSHRQLWTALVFHWFACFGIPANLTSERGPQFTSQLWSSIAQLLGTQVHLTTTYHPLSNGLMERFYQHLKPALRAHLTGPNWTQELPCVLLGIQSAPKEDLECSSAELVYGTPITVPGNFIPSNSTHSDGFQLWHLHDRVHLLAPIPTLQHGAVPTYMPRNLQQARFVFV